MRHLLYTPDARVDIELKGNELVIRNDGLVLLEFVLNETDRAYTEQKLIDNQAEEVR